MQVGKNITSIVSGHAHLDYVTLNEAKVQNNVAASDTSFDAELTLYIKSAMHYLSQCFGYSIQKANAVYYFDSLERGEYLRIPAKVISITSVKYIDENDAEQTLDYKATLTNSLGLDIKVTGDTTGLTEADGKYKVSVVEGFELASASGVNESAKFNESIKIAVLMLLAQYFTNRQAVAFTGSISELPHAVKTIIYQNSTHLFT